MKKRSSNEKLTIYLAIFFILFLVVMLVLYFFGIIGGKEKTVDIVLNKNIIVKYTQEKWKKEDKKNYNDYNWDKFKVYEEGNKKGEYSLYYDDDKFYLFEEKSNKRTPILTLENSLYLGGKKESKFIEYNQEIFDDNDKEYVKSILKDNKVSNNDLNNYVLGYKIIKDFDNDNEKETMYIVSNMFAMNVSDTAYSIMFIRDGKNSNIIYKKIVDADKRFSSCLINLLGLVKIDDVDSVQIITSCKSYSVSNNNEYGIYQNRNNTYELLLYIK